MTTTAKDTTDNTNRSLAALTVAPVDFATIAEIWAALVPESITPFPFVSPAWAEPWWQVFGTDTASLLLLSVTDATGALIAVAPLMIEHTDDLGRAVRFLGGVDVTDYLDLIVRPADAERSWGAVVGWLLAHRDTWDALDFHCLPDASPSRSLIAEAVARADMGVAVLVAQEEVCPAAPLYGGFEAYLAQIGKKNRNEIRRKERNLLREAPDAALRVLTERDDALAALPDFFRLHRLSAPDKERFLTPTVETFFGAITARMADAGTLRLYVLEMGGEAVAMMYAFAAAGRLLVYNSGYDPTRSATSVGMVLTGMMIASAAESGLTVCDFMRGNEAYKYRFGATDVPLWRVIAGTNAALLERARAAMMAHLAVPADDRDHDEDNGNDNAGNSMPDAR